MPAGTKPRKLPKRSGSPLLTCRLNISPRRTPRLRLTKRCILIWSTKLTLVERSACDEQLDLTRADSSLRYQVTKMLSIKLRRELWRPSGKDLQAAAEGVHSLLSPVMEKKGILGNTTGRRP